MARSIEPKRLAKIQAGEWLQQIGRKNIFFRYIGDRKVQILVFDYYKTKEIGMRKHRRHYSTYVRTIDVDEWPDRRLLYECPWAQRKINARIQNNLSDLTWIVNIALAVGTPRIDHEYDEVLTSGHYEVIALDIRHKYKLDLNDQSYKKVSRHPDI